MISITSYLDFVRSKSKLDAEGTDSAIIALEGQLVDKGYQNPDDLLADDETPPMRGKYLKSPSMAYVLTLDEIEDELRNDDICDNYIYDKIHQIVLLNLFRGRHEYTMAKLFEVYHGNSMLPYEIRAERFITDGFGWYLSSCATRPTRGGRIMMSALEEKIFGTNFATYR